ncbi:MAG: hypothetical protein HN348_01920, partial [Proteobacteria bacterium]|nr:hypothetical protein [Pseudomonadota bacterium]
MSDSGQLERVSDVQTLQQAWRKVRIGSSSPGIDRVNATSYGKGVNERLVELSRRLRQGSYRPRPALRLRLRDAPERPLAVATVEDRIVQRALADVLTPMLDARMSDTAYGYRRGCSVTDALEVARRHISMGRRWYLRTDVEKFFDQLDRERLLAQLGEAKIEESVVGLIAKLLKAKVLEGASVYNSGLGVAQGSALSPLLSNVYLTGVDRAMSGFAYLRFADDVLVLSPTADEAVDAMGALQEEVEGVGLRLNARKTRRGHLGGGFDYLGVRFDSSGSGLSRSAWKALEQTAFERLDDALVLAELIDEWTRWYGNVEPETIQSLPVIVACVMRAAARDDDQMLKRLAEQRLGVSGGPLSPGQHVRLVEIWAPLEGEAAARATMLEAIRAVREKANRKEVERMTRALGVSVETVLAFDHPLPVVAKLLFNEGATVHGRATKQLGEAQSDTPPVAPRLSDVEVERFLLSYRGREGVHAVEHKDHRGHFRFIERRGTLLVEEAREHLEGGARLGVHLIREDATVCFGMIRVYVNRKAMMPPWAAGVANHLSSTVKRHWEALVAAAHDHATSISRSAARLGLPTWIEDDGANARVVWLFFSEPVRQRYVRMLLVRILEDIGDAPEEVRRQL